MEKDFQTITERVHFYITNNQFKEALSFLEKEFRGDPDLDVIVMNLAQYNLLLNNDLQGVVNPQDVNQQLNKLNSNILKFIRAKQEYYKYKSETFKKVEFDVEDDEKEIMVFFSVASPFNTNQQLFINKLKAFFKPYGIILQPLVSWNEDDPVLPIIDELKASSGCLVLALERYFIEAGKEKRGSQQEVELSTESLTSPWLHIETAIARSLDLPLLILKDENLKNEGLIHNDKQSWGIARVKEEEPDAIHEYPLKHFISNWIKDVKKFHEQKNQ